MTVAVRLEQYCRYKDRQDCPCHHELACLVRTISNNQPRHAVGRTCPPSTAFLRYRLPLASIDVSASTNREYHPQWSLKPPRAPPLAERGAGVCTKQKVRLTSCPRRFRLG